LKIKIKYLSDKIEKLKKIEIGNWIDLRCAKETVLLKGESALIPLGIAMQLPPNFEAHIAPRSSTFKNFHVLQTNTPGIVDNSYCGDEDEWKMSVLAIEDTIIHINDRICQFRIVEKQPDIEFEEVETLGNNSRGGFGSTGIQ
jgi:dUTP pyrophosphatase